MSKTKYAKAIKVVSTILMVLMLVSVANSVLATTPRPDSITPDYTQSGDITSLGGKILGIITTIGMVVSVIVLVILGIKYMIGSASEKAEYKKTMIPYLIGAILVFGASAIAQVVMNVSNTFATGTGN